MKKRRLKVQSRTTGDTFDFSDGYDFKCPWCGAVCTVSLSNCGVLHPKPACDEFMHDDHGPVEILEAANAQLRKERLS